MPEGVQPASGVLAHIARVIFGDLEFCISAQDNLVVGGNALKELYAKYFTHGRAHRFYSPGR